MNGLNYYILGLEASKHNIAKYVENMMGRLNDFSIMELYSFGIGVKKLCESGVKIQLDKLIEALESRYSEFIDYYANDEDKYVYVKFSLYKQLIKILKAINRKQKK